MSQILRAGDRFSVGGGLGTHFFLFGDKVFSPGRDTCSACGYSSWALCLTSRNGKNRTLGNENGSEGSKFSAFHPPVLPPDVIASEVDVFEGRQVFKQVVAHRQTMCFQGLNRAA
jgi:hypothetical protein